jgi:hypothetical protein
MVPGILERGARGRMTFICASAEETMLPTALASERFDNFFSPPVDLTATSPVVKGRSFSSSRSKLSSDSIMGNQKFSIHQYC